MEGNKLSIKEKNNISNIILVILVILNGIALFNKNIYDFYTIFSLYFMFAISIILFILNFNCFKKKEVIFVSILTFYLIIDSILFTHAFGTAITLLLFVVLVITTTKFQIDKKFFLILLILMISLNLFLFFKAIKYKYTGIIDFNTNIAAMNLLISLIYILILFRNYKINIVLQFLFIVISVIGIFNLDSRTTFISLIFFIIMLYLFPKRVLLKKIPFWVITITILLLSIIVPFIYTYLWKNSLNIEYTFFGKRLFTGREMMWNELFTNLDSIIKVMFGLGDKMKFSNGLYNAHNISLHIIMSCGLIGLIFYYAFIFKKMNSFIKNKLNLKRIAIDNFIAFLTIIIYGYFENPLQTNRMLFLFLFITMFNSEFLLKTEVKEESNQLTNSDDKKTLT